MQAPDLSGSRSACQNLLPRLALPWLALVSLLLPLAPPSWAEASTAALTLGEKLPDLVESVLPGVVNISSTTIREQTVYQMDSFFRLWGIPNERKQTSLGSGFILDKAGYILTNNHVVADADEVMVTLNDKRQYEAKIIGKDQKTDLALLKIKAPENGAIPSLKPVPLGNSDAVRIAEPVFAVGNPFGLQHTVTSGIISAKNRTIGLGPFDNFLQTDASINPGNSGGPLFNMKGEVIGINTVIFSKVGQSGGVGFAIPANEARDTIEDLKRYGRVPRPWLGVLGERVTPQLARYYRLSTDTGVVIYDLVRRGPADQAGLEQGDIVIEANGQAVKEVFDLERELAKRKPREAITLKIRRGRGVPRDVKVSLEELPRLENLPQGIL
jgi:serine protease Do